MLETLWNIMQIIAAGIITLGGAGGIVIGLYRWAKKPNDSQNARLDEHDELLDNDNRRLKILEDWKAEKTDSEKIIMKSMLALMTHAIDGNHVEELKQARDDLQSYLISK